MVKTDCDISTNYTNRRIKGNDCEVNFSNEDKPIIWFNIQISDKEDDYLTLTFRADDLFSSIGKAIQRADE